MMRCAPLTRSRRQRPTLRLAIVAFTVLLASQAAAQAPADASRTQTAGWHWRLAGLVIDKEQQVAVLAQGQDTRSLVIGDELDGWTLAVIRRSEVVLTNAGQQMTLGLEGLPPEIAAAMARARDEQDAATSAVEQASQQQRQDQATAESALAHATQVMRSAATR